MRACDDQPSWLFDWRGQRDSRSDLSVPQPAPRRDERAPSQSDVDRPGTDER